MKGLMVVGTASDVGKSMIATAICRALVEDGVRVAPFKSQNMSNNSYVTKDGKEIGRAQGIQAEAAKIEATVYMNPILLKPTSDSTSEVVLFGKAETIQSGRDYRASFYEKGLEAITIALNRLENTYDVIVMEGAGSPVEINLKDRELVNMKVAEMADVPVLLVADIDRGGVFASIVGTLSLLEENERSRVKAIIINKFRGDLSLFADGKKWIEDHCGIPVIGVMPYLHHHMIDAEDSLSIQVSKKDNPIDIAILKPPYLSNFTDMDPFLYEDDVSFRWVNHSDEMGMPDAVILPGTKSTIHDWQYFCDRKLDKWLKHYIENGGRVIGICGGFQMLGRRLADPYGADTGIEGKEINGLGVIPADTTFITEKTTIQVEGTLHPKLKGSFVQSLKGYEIHLGETVVENHDRHYFLKKADGHYDGYTSKGGKVIGTYMHHVFHHDEWRAHWLNQIRVDKGLPLKDPVYISNKKDKKYAELAAHFKSNIDFDLLKEIIGIEDHTS